MENKQKTIITAVAVVIIIAVGFWYWSQRKTPEQAPVEPVGAVGAAQEVSEAVPEIQTNPGEKVPEVNPLDRANPFKYINPLR